MFSLGISQESLQVSEVYKPLQDPLIAQCVKIIDMDKDHSGGSRKLVSAARSIWSKIFPKPRRAWLPTGCLVSGDLIKSYQLLMQ